MCDVHPSLLMRADKAYGERQAGEPFSAAFYFPFECERVRARCISCCVLCVRGQSEIQFVFACVSRREQLKQQRRETRECVCV